MTENCMLLIRKLKQYSDQYLAIINTSFLKRLFLNDRDECRLWQYLSILYIQKIQKIVFLWVNFEVLCSAKILCKHISYCSM